MTPTRRPRVMFYVQHLLGVGHQTRAAAIVRAMQERGLEVFYVSGGFNELSLELAGATFIQLPPARTADASFSTLLDEHGNPVNAGWEGARRNALLDAHARIQPDVLLVESFPFGRRRFRFELLPLLDLAKGNVAVAASVRDILVERDDPKRTRWIVDTVRQYFDTVIVHGDPAIASFDDSFAGAPDIADRIRYSGYVTGRELSVEPGSRKKMVVVSAGGGAVGGPLLKAAIDARPFTRLAEAPWRVITGPNLPKNDRVGLFAPEGVTIDTFRDDFHDILNETALSISQAGYNTIMDLLMTRTRAVLVPFDGPGQTEQLRRAEILAARGHFHIVTESELSPRTLAATVDRALNSPRPQPAAIDFNGAAQSAEIIAELATGR